MDFVGTVWALLPPVIAIVLALITKEVYMSLFIGVHRVRAVLEPHAERLTVRRPRERAQ